MVQGTGGVWLCAEVQRPASGRWYLRWALASLLAIPALAVPHLRAQEPVASVNAPGMPSFEVATIKPARPGMWRQDYDTDGNRLTVTNYTVRRLIREAYGLKSDSQVLGGPEWIDRQAFDILAKVDDAEAARMDKMNDEQSDREWALMLQSLLADRFQLRVTRGERSLPVFALVVARSGPKVKHTPEKSVNAQDGDPGIDIHGGELTANAVSMDAFADTLTSLRDLGNRVVINRTGLAGNYNFQLDWARDRGQGPPPDSPYPGLFAALPDQLGLKLKPERSTVDVVVVESAAEPSVN
jgi:uncharacterized protein (TIGR03435 family)